MKLGLDGKIVLVTGGSKGIGLACARAFAEEGARVAIASRSPENLERGRGELARGGFNVAVVKADFSVPKEAQAAVRAAEEQLGPIDILINSAGAAKRFSVETYNADAWHQGMDAKYFPYVHAMDAVRLGMTQRRRGSIVNIIGMGGKMAQPFHLSGGAANAALMLVTVGWANVLGPHGVRVNAINPASTLTERVNQAMRLEAQTQGITEAEALERGQAKVPLRRYARPEEVAAATLFLASEKASYINGVVLPMDGGAVPVI